MRADKVNLQLQAPFLSLLDKTMEIITTVTELTSKGV